MISSIALFVLSALLFWGWRVNQRFAHRALTEGYHAHAVVQELRREAMRYYAWVGFFGPDGGSKLRRVECPRKEKEDLPFQVGQVIEVVDYRQRLYWQPQLQSSTNIMLLLAVGSLVWALVELYTALV